MAKKELNRKEYDRIRKMDHKSMEAYFREQYEKGFEAANKANEVSIDKINLAIEKIASLPGIGEKKLSLIKEILNESLIGQEVS